MKVLEFHKKTMKIKKNPRIRCENHESNENHKIPRENYKTCENPRTSYENHRKSFKSYNSTRESSKS